MIQCIVMMAHEQIPITKEHIAMHTNLILSVCPNLRGNLKNCEFKKGEYGS